MFFSGLYFICNERFINNVDVVVIFFISGNFFFSTSLAYITIPQNKREIKITWGKKLTTTFTHTSACKHQEHTVLHLNLFLNRKKNDAYIITIIIIIIIIVTIIIFSRNNTHSFS